MHRVLITGAAVLLILHGVIHLLGPMASWRLGKLEALPYKTTLLGGAWNVGDPGIRVFGGLRLVPALGFVGSGIALLAGGGWWSPVIVLMAVVCLGLTLLDWSVAYAGAVVNVVILGVLWLGPAVSGWLSR
jgi:hypothetical protein